MIWNVINKTICFKRKQKITDRKEIEDNQCRIDEIPQSLCSFRMTSLLMMYLTYINTTEVLLKHS